MKQYPYHNQLALISLPAFAAGIILDFFISFHPFLCLVLTCLSAFFLLYSILFKKSLLFVSLLCILFFFFSGLFRSDIFFHYRPKNHIVHYAGHGETKFICIADKEANFRRHTGRIQASTLFAGRTETNMKATKGRVLIISKAPVLSNIQIGDTLQFFAKTALPYPARNIGDFDYRQYLMNRGIALILKTDSIHVRQLHGFSLSRQFGKIRKSISRIIDLTMPENHADRSIARTSILGPQSDMPAETKEDFRAAGLLHILAVSGFHTGVIISIFWFLISIFCRIRVLRFIGTLSVLWFYVFLTGMPASAERAAWMASILLLGHYMEKPYISTNTLAVAAIIILFLRPGMVFDAGFQLSIAATFGIIIYFRNKQELLPAKLLKPPILMWLTNMFMISLTATLFVLPILLRSFGRFTIWGLLAGIPASLLASASMICDIMILALYPVSASLARLYGAVNSVLLDLLRVTADAFSNLPFNNISLPIPNYREMFFYYLILFGIYHFRKRWAKRMIVWTVAVSIAFTGVTAALPKHFEWYVFDVGNGDAMLLRFPDGKNVLVDAGNCRWRNGETQESKILGLMRRIGIKKIDTAVISHFDSDHFCGLLSVLDSMKVMQVFGNGLPESTITYKSFVRKVHAHKIPFRPLRGGMKIEGLPEGFSMRAVHPFRRYRNKNDNSVVLLLNCYGRSILFTGDTGEQAQQDLCCVVPHADILKAPHHGELDPHTLEWIKELNPEFIFISNKSKKREKVLMTQNKFKVYSTSVCGMIRIKIYKTDSNNGIKGKVDIEPYIRPLKFRKNFLL